MSGDVSGPVFITGALGFIGRTLADRLRSEGIEVRGVDVRSQPDSGVIAGDVSEPGPWQEHARGCELVIHTAAIVSNAVGLGEQWRVNVGGTRRALDAAARGGASRFVHFSSVRAFSDVDFPDGVDERHPVRPDGNPYTDTKIASEQVALQAHAAGEIQCTVIRPGDVYGPRSRPWTLLPVEAIKARRFVLPARGQGVLAPTYVENLVDGVMLAATRPEAAGQVFTISDGAGVSCAEFFGHYARMLGVPPPTALPTTAVLALAAVMGRVERIRDGSSELNATTVRYLTRSGSYSIQRARRLLGYSPRVDLDEGMRRTEAWLRSEGLV